MKQTLLFAKAALCILVIQLATINNSSARGKITYPTRATWLNLTAMGPGSQLETCVVPELLVDKYIFHVSIMIVTARDLLPSDPAMELYYDLPNGETGFQSINQLTAISSTLREEYDIPEDFTHAAWQIFQVCTATCPANYCGQLSFQLLSDGGPFPIAQSSLFPNELCEYDEFGNAYHYTEYKEICCPGGMSNPNPSPCEPYGGSGIQHTPAPENYSNTGSNCLMPFITNTDKDFVHPEILFRQRAFEKEEMGLSLKLYPNPATGSTTVQYKNSNLGETSFVWMDTQGKLIEKLVLANNEVGEISKTFDTSSWAPGIYFLYLTSTDGSKTIRFVRSSD